MKGEKAFFAQLAKRAELFRTIYRQSSACDDFLFSTRLHLFICDMGRTSHAFIIYSQGTMNSTKECRQISNDFGITHRHTLNSSFIFTFIRFCLFCFFPLRSRRLHARASRSKTETKFIRLIRRPAKNASALQKFSNLNRLFLGGSKSKSG